MTLLNSACSSWSSTFLGVSLSPLEYKPPRKILLRAEQSRLQQRDEVEQFLKIVLHRRRGEQKNKLLLNLAGEFP